jgi:hypothetical protein
MTNHGESYATGIGKAALHRWLGKLGSGDAAVSAWRVNGRGKNQGIHIHTTSNGDVRT